MYAPPALDRPGVHQHGVWGEARRRTQPGAQGLRARRAEAAVAAAKSTTAVILGDKDNEARTRQFNEDYVTDLAEIGAGDGQWVKALRARPAPVDVIAYDDGSDLPSGRSGFDFGASAF